MIGPIKIAVVGASGYVGKAIADKIAASNQYAVTRVSRENYMDCMSGAYDILINCAMPSKRFWAKNNPALDFVETVQKTADLVYGWKYGKFIQVSTVSARCELDSVYGRHKAAAEILCASGNFLIVRLSAMYSAHLPKGVLVDIINEAPVYVSGASRFPFVSLDFVASWIATHLNEKGIVEVGARDTVSLEEIAKALSKNIIFQGPCQDQSLVNPELSFPSSYEVIDFMKTLMEERRVK